MHRIGQPLRDAVDDLPFMRASGCTEVTGLPPVGAVRFQGKDGRWRSYHCPGVGKAAVRAAIGRFHEAKAERAARHADGQVRVMAATGYFVLTAISTQWCVQTQTHFYVGGVYKYTETTIVPGSCFWVTTYSVEFIGGDMPQPWEDYCCAGPGGPPDDDPPPPQPPPPPPADTCPTADGHFGILRVRAVQDSFGAALSRSVQGNTELGGFIWKHPEKDEIIATQGTINWAQTDACDVKFTGADSPPKPGMIPIATWHTHPYADLTQIWCSVSQTELTAYNDGLGGGSPTDWMQANDLGIPVYTISPTRLARLDPFTPSESRADNPNIWNRVPGGCALN
jgi:hypothetical protein